MTITAVPIGTALAVVVFVFNLFNTKADIKEVEKLEKKQEKHDEYIMEQREWAAEQKVETEYMKRLLQKIDKKLEE